MDLELELRGARLRPFRLDDAKSVARYANDRSVWRNLTDGFPHPYSPGDFVAFLKMLEDQAAAHPESRAHVFAFEVEGEAVGACGIHPKSDVFRKGAQIGYWLGAPFRGRGLATQAVQLLTGLAFERLDLVRLEAGVFSWNKASARVLEKCGYQLEAVLRKSVFKDGQVIDDHLYVRLKGE